MSNYIFNLPRVWLPRIKYSVKFSLRAQRDADVGSLILFAKACYELVRLARGIILAKRDSLCFAWIETEVDNNRITTACIIHIRNNDRINILQYQRHAMFR